MRILAVTNLFPNAAQPQRAMFNFHQLTALSLQHRVHIIAPVAWTTAWRPVAPLVMNNDIAPASQLSISHPRYLFTPKMFRGGYGHFFGASIRDQFHAAVRSIQPDIVLGCWAYPDGWAAVKLAREAGLPVVVKVHGSDLMMIAPESRSGGRARRTREALQSADGVIAVGRHLRDRAAMLGADPSRMRIVRNGVDTGVFHPGGRAEARARVGHPATTPLILSVGNLAPVKGHTVLVKALGALTSRNWRCVIIGQGQERRRLATRIASLGLSNNVDFLPPCPQKSLAEWYRAADMLVLPSLSEGVPNVAMEAAACGTPIIASDVGGVADVVPAEGLVPPGDPTTLAARLDSWLNSPPPASTLASSRTWAESAAELASTLAEVAASYRSRRVAA